MSSVSALSSSLHDWENVYEYISAYGGHVALCAILSAVTVYRREISCNRSYHEDGDVDEEDSNSDNKTKGNNKTLIRSARLSYNNATISSDNEEQELMTEQLLEGAGLYCSGRPMLNFAELLWLGFGGDDSDENKEPKLNDLTPEDLLDRVGNYASPEPILAIMALYVLWKKKTGLQLLSSSLSSSISSSSSSSSSRHKNHGYDPLTNDMPIDVHVQIASFLHPRDVVTLSCVSNYYRVIMTSEAIWQTLWHRDYAWIVYQWKIGKEALQRSNCTQWSYSKDFYFLFGQSYLDYVLAGRNTFKSCLVGIHSNIYDITPFLFSHPGKFYVYGNRDNKPFNPIVYTVFLF